MIVGIMNISPMFEDEILYDRCFNAVSDQRQEKIKKHKNYKDRCRIAGAGVLLNILVGRYLACEDEEQKKDSGLAVVDIYEAVENADAGHNRNVRYGKNGKPEFEEDGGKNVHFNLSHSGEYVVCVVSDSCVGIDIEGKRPVKYGVAEHFFTDEENENIKNDEHFFELWTFKEAYGKYTGDGIVRNLCRTQKEVADLVNIRRYEHDGYKICVVGQRL